MNPVILAREDIDHYGITGQRSNRMYPSPTMFTVTFSAPDLAAVPSLPDHCNTEYIN